MTADSEFDPSILEGLAVFEFFRMLGYSPAEIYFHASQEAPGVLTLSIVLRHSGKQYAVRVGDLVASSEEEGRKRWVEAAARFKELPENQSVPLWLSSKTHRAMGAMLLQMHALGFIPPALQRAR